MHVRIDQTRHQHAVTAVDDMAAPADDGRATERVDSSVDDSQVGGVEHLNPVEQTRASDHERLVVRHTAKNRS